MSSTTARDPRNDRKRTDEAILEGDAQFIAGLKVFSGDSDSVSGLAGGNAQNSPKAPAGNYLAREGDSMIGPIALGPPVNFRVVIGTEEEINISNLGDSPQYSSNIELDSIQPNGFVLDRIDGAAFDGQVLIIRTFGPDSFTISQATLANGGNIQTATDDDFELEALQMIILVFDEALQVFANTGGTWRVLSGAGGGGVSVGTYASAVMDQDQVANMALNDHFQFNDYVENGGIVLQGLTPTFDQTSGIFELKAGKTYSLEADVSGEFNSNADSAQIVWYDRTNAVELGARGKSNPLSSAGQLTNKHSVNTIITPVTDIDVEVRIVALVGTINTAFANASQANIFEFSGKNGAPGPAGPPGSGQNWKIPARAKSTADVPSLAAADVIFDGITLIEDDRVLLTDQTTQSENGLWQVGVVAAGFAPLTRPTDFDTDAEVVAETFVPIEEGNTQKDTLWHLISDNPLTIDVSVQVWEIFAPGTSGGPNLGGGEDGIDGAGEFVNDGRVGIGRDRLKRIQQRFGNIGPTYAMNDLLYIPGEQPPFNDLNKIGRLVVSGRMDQTPITLNGALSDDYGFTYSAVQINTAGVSTGTFAYDPVQQIAVVTGGPTAALASQSLRRSLDRGSSWLSTALGSLRRFTDLIWSPRLGLFIALESDTADFVDVIFTSPDGNTWTQQTTPAGTPDPPTIAVIWQALDDAPGLGKVVVVGSRSLDILTSVDGITWILETMATPTAFTFPQTPEQLVWSEGQQKFLMRPTAGNTKTEGIFLSPDGITWTQHLLPNLVGAAVLNGVYDIVWIPELSMWLGCGKGDVNVQIFWVSNDGESWYNMPDVSMRRENHDITEPSTYFVTIPRAVTYSPEFGYIFAVGNTQRTSGAADFLANRAWRTEVFFNGAIGAT